VRLRCHAPQASESWKSRCEAEGIAGPTVPGVGCGHLAESWERRLPANRREPARCRGPAQSAARTRVARTYRLLHRPLCAARGKPGRRSTEPRLHPVPGHAPAQKHEILRAPHETDGGPADGARVQETERGCRAESEPADAHAGARTHGAGGVKEHRATARRGRTPKGDARRSRQCPPPVPTARTSPATAGSGARAEVYAKGTIPRPGHGKARRGERR
jgi:hypothetical protein